MLAQQAEAEGIIRSHLNYRQPHVAASRHTHSSHPSTPVAVPSTCPGQMRTNQHLIPSASQARDAATAHLPNDINPAAPRPLTIIRAATTSSGKPKAPNPDGLQEWARIFKDS
jgi:hypothetical protein